MVIQNQWILNCSRIGHLKKQPRSEELLISRLQINSLTILPTAVLYTIYVPFAFKLESVCIIQPISP